MPVAWKHPEKINPEFKSFYEAIVLESGLSLPITSDWRSSESNAAAGGVPTSLHVLGSAGDVDLPPKNAKLCWQLTKAVMRVADRMGLETQVELELVNSAKDTHAHVGLNPRAPGAKLIVRAD